MRIKKGRVPKYSKDTNFNEELISNTSFIFDEFEKGEIPDRHLALAGALMNVINTKIN